MVIAQKTTRLNTTINTLRYDQICTIIYHIKDHELNNMNIYINDTYMLRSSRNRAPKSADFELFKLIPACCCTTYVNITSDVCHVSFVENGQFDVKTI